jgi:hypothetical protein
MGNRRMGLSRLEALLEAVDRDLNLENTTLTSPAISGAVALSLGTEAIIAAGGASITIPVSLVTSDGDTMAVSLADGTTVGQLKYFVSIHATLAFIVTPVTTAGSYASFTLTNIGETVTCIWTAAGWALLSRSSGAAEAVNSIAAAPLVS